jgi:DNA replication factor GINS
MMDLDELRAVQTSERRTDSLQSLRDSFYQDVAEYINELREERARAAERADDPFGSEEVRHLTDEIETAQEVAEAVYDRRLGKVVKRASLAAAGMSADEEGLTDEEADLFAAVVDEIESRREGVLSGFAGETNIASTATGGGADDPDPPGRGERPTADEKGTTEGTKPPGGDMTTPGFDASEAMGGGGAPTEPTPEGARDDPPEGVRDDDHPGESERTATGTEGATPDGGQLATDRTTVRITRDVGEVLGVDESAYDLADGDVVTLPSANAKPLIERDAADRIE